MNTLGLSLIWTALQVTLFCLAGGGLYLAARRRHPARGAAVLCGTLLMTAGIAALSFSPWPRWWTLASVAQTATGPEPLEAAATIPLVEASPTTTVPTFAAKSDAASAGGTSPANVGALNLLSGLWSNVHRQLNATTTVDSAASGWHWPAWLAAIALTGIGLGLARVILGMIGLFRLLRDTRPVADPALVNLLEQLRGQTGCRRPIELREMAGSNAGGSPAVVGWLRPVILLPADWRLWSTQARQVILAHETAHVAHGDFLMWLVAQVGVILHFYNPFVHWLAHRLRIEQELAADLCGAPLAGGPKSYLTVLAQLALQQDESRQLWAGRPFFPTRGTLMRRIEMLHDQHFVTVRPWSGGLMTSLLVALALVGLGVSGLRGPARTARAADAPAEKQPVEATSQIENNALLPRFDNSYFPAETIAVISLKPVKVANSKVAIQPTFLQFPNAFGFGFGSSNDDKEGAWEIEELKAIVLAPTEPAPAERPAVFIYRMRRPYDQSKIRVKIFGEAPDGVTELTLHGHKCLRATSEVTGDVVNYLLVDDRTVVVLLEKDVAGILAADSKGHPAWYKYWQEVEQSPIAFGADCAALMTALNAPDNDPKEAADPAEQLFESIVKQTALVFGHVDSTAAGLEISATVHCQSAEKAISTGKLVKGLLEMCSLMVPELMDPALLPTEFQSLDVGGALGKALADLTTTTNVKTNQFRLETKIDADFVSRFIEATEGLLARQTEEFKAAVEKAHEAHSANLGRLVKALNAYHTAHGHYPPAAVIGPDGKTAHSWRVELLPLLGEQRLYDSYHLDEPWDSEHNKELIKRIPAVYGTSKWSNLGDADYFVVTGQGTLFDGDAAPKRESITDAAGETILLVESRRPIPWTKPADIDVSADSSPLRLGRTRGDGFHAAFADGTVKFIPKATDAATIQALFTKAAGDEVKLR